MRCTAEFVFFFPAVPGGYAADETAATNGYEQGVEPWALLFEFEADASLAEQSLELVVSVNGHGAGLRGPGFAGGEGISIALADYDEVRATTADALHLFRGSDIGDKHLRGYAQFAAGQVYRHPA